MVNAGAGVMAPVEEMTFPSPSTMSSGVMTAALGSAGVMPSPVKVTDPKLAR